MLIAVEQDKETGELYLPIPQSMMDEMGWKIGDKVTWELGENRDAKITIRKSDEQ